MYEVRKAADADGDSIVIIAVTDGYYAEISKLLSENGWRGRFVLHAVDDSFVPHAPVNSLLARFRLDTEGMYETITEIYPHDAERTE